MKLRHLLLTLTLAAALTSCASYTYNPADLRLGVTLAASQFIQYSPNKTLAVTEVNSAVMVLQSFKEAPTPELFKAALAAKLPQNETKDLLVRDLGAVYTRFYPSIPKTPVAFNAALMQLRLGLVDAVAPF